MKQLAHDNVTMASEVSKYYLYSIEYVLLHVQIIQLELLEIISQSQSFLWLKYQFGLLISANGPYFCVSNDQAQ